MYLGSQWCHNRTMLRQQVQDGGRAEVEAKVAAATGSVAAATGSVAVVRVAAVQVELTVARMEALGVTPLPGDSRLRPAAQ
jgi:hypothetical protein